MEDLIMAKNAPKTLKASYLIKASSQLEITTIKLRLFLELRLVNETKIFQTQTKLAEIGRMLGGWLRATQST
ncbi:four helix bundle protein [Candidatus Peregrinibacteria bacterium]|nr:four helix bundle protein [Candidatus Peregrinibacteria bacterium]